MTAYDVDGNEGFIVEQSGVPYLKPLTPSNFSVDPQWHKVFLRWNSNKELDLAGYNVYRSVSQSDQPSKLNSAVLKDTTFLDTNAENGWCYYYSVAAVDNAQNESNRTITLRSRVVSLDQGVLIADETRGGDGSPMNPTHAQVDSFYRALLGGFKTQVLDVEAQGGATLADLRAFSTVVWHGDDPSSFAAALSSQKELRKYLDYGGKLLVSSYKPTTAFGNNASYPHDFKPGDFVYDYLKISHVENKFLARFIGASPIVIGYPAVDVDTAKTLASTNHHLTQIEGIGAAPSATNIYRYETKYDTTRLEGKMKGQPVGIEYLGTDFKLIVLSFPLYYMDFDVARTVVRFVLFTKFSEPLTVQGNRTSVPAKFELFQNYPNPYNPTTTIGYELANGGFVSLKVFSVLGEELVSLVHGEQSAGCYAVVFDARDLPSGVYIYRLQVGMFSDTRKMLLLH